MIRHHKITQIFRRKFMKRLELCHVSFSYTEEPLIEDLSLTIEEQEGCILLCGRNGAGKTTLLNLICGLYPHEGEIRRDDFHIAYLPYENPLMENETVLSNLQFFLWCNARLVLTRSTWQAALCSALLLPMSVLSGSRSAFSKRFCLAAHLL